MTRSESYNLFVICTHGEIVRVFPDDQAAAWYLAAMVDGEGSVSKVYDSYGKRCGNRHIAITNTDVALIDAVCSALARLGIEHNRHSDPDIRQPHYRLRHEVHVTNYRSLKRFHDVVPIQAPAKKERLEGLLASYRYGIRCPRREDLYQWYVVEDRSLNDIAAQLGVTHGSVMLYLQRHGIPKRPADEMYRRGAHYRQNRLAERIAREHVTAG